jgi:hypothetical protein
MRSLNASTHIFNEFPAQDTSSPAARKLLTPHATALPGRLHPALREIPRDQLEMPTALRFGNQSVECQENCETCQPY